MPETPWKRFGLVLGIAAGLILSLADTPLSRLNDGRPAYAAGVAVMMAIWWITESLPIHITALVPLVFFPILGIFGDTLSQNIAGSVLPYVDPYIWLFAGGMCVAASMQQWDLHRRIALKVMKFVGTDPKRLLGGFLISTAFVSLWISNTATATMMMPIGMAVILQLEDQLKLGKLKYYGMAIMLAIAYGSNVGGIGTKIGTAPNAQLSGFLARQGIDISFHQFMAVGFPFVVLFLPIVWYALWRVARRNALPPIDGSAAIDQELSKLGVIKREESIVLSVFLGAAAMWIFGREIGALLKPYAPFELTTAHVEGGTALLAAIVLMALRSVGRSLLEFKSLRFVPWETLLLLGGGFAMAAGIQASGLSTWMAHQLAGLRDIAEIGQVMVASFSSVGLSAVASNTATTAVMLTVLKDAVTPALMPTVLFASTIAASCDFALPAGTPPNAIVFGSGYVTIPQMARTGIVLDFLAALLAACWCYVIVRFVI